MKTIHRPHIPVQLAAQIDRDLARLANDCDDILKALSWALNDFTAAPDLRYLHSHLKRTFGRLNRAQIYSRKVFDTAYDAQASAGAWRYPGLRGE